MDYRIPPFEMDRLVRVVRREDMGDDRIAASLARVDGLPEPEPSNLITGPDCSHRPLIMQDGTLFNSRGIHALPQGIWPARRVEGVWVAKIQ
ncbi:hypothetical protein [Fimbriimonas ginsengisoli]|uniref:Uncharacterized protein n=1 Tax=Fimbriimonas ginsengisoli Gsoil 348 TaxID=661478 RepID=A0A068NPT1_FIMGI|nr:hypothetical protein [Fimbriimonas ginsengisoli]AIE84775.1 hypothetical protein OP10G_1407 [Fimbriimonas ginsengisoli Gsoil 348]